MTNTFELRNRQIVIIGSKGSIQFPNLVACPDGSNNGWVTGVNNEENRDVVNGAIDDFMNLLPNDKSPWLQQMDVSLDPFSKCTAYFDHIELVPKQQASVKPGFYVHMRLIGPDALTTESFRDALHTEIKFFINGRYEIEWVGEKNVNVPYITDFEIHKFGHHNAQNNKVHIVFDIT